MPCCSPSCQKWTLFSISGIALLLGLLTVIFWNQVVQAIKRSQLNVGSENTIEYKMWKETPIPMYIEFYLYNWTNSQEVIDKKWSIKPSVQQLGPYTYSEKHIRKEVKFNNNHTVTYKTQRIWHYIPKMSNGSLDDEITTVNTILATIGNIVKPKHDLVKLGVNFFLEEKRINLTVTKTAREFLFDGYDDPMIDLLRKLNTTGINIPFDKFAWFYSRNESIDFDGVYNMYDGTSGLEKLGVFTSWNYANRTEIYPKECGMVNGTSGELWYPVGSSPSIQIFSPDTCSTVTLERVGETERFGLQGHRYVGQKKNFDNGTLYPEMACFSPGQSVPSGVRNVSECKYGAPAFVSYPHFYLADQFYRDAVDGMHPNKTEHEFFMSLEPETGIPLEVAAAFQINIFLQQVNRIKLLEEVKDTFIPTMWFKQYANLNEDLASQAKLLLVLPSVGTYTGYGILGIGLLLLVIGLVVTWKKGWKAQWVV